ncbi:hypothetical protein D3C72_700800 [compost metagenome]
MTKEQFNISCTKTEPAWKILNSAGNHIHDKGPGGTGFKAAAVIRALRKVAFDCLFQPNWKEIIIDTDLPEQATKVFGYSKEWINEDFNPEGIRECHYCGTSIEDAEWQSSKWCNSCDEWHADDTVPTHWLPFEILPPKE